MKKNRFTNEQFIGFHNQAEAGMPNKEHSCTTASPWPAIAAQLPVANASRLLPDRPDQGT